MKKLIRTIPFLALIIILGCGEGGVTNNGHVTGSVVDISNNPVAGATVTIAGVTSTTGSGGTFDISNLPIGNQTIAVSAPGFISSAKQIEVLVMEVTYVPMFVLSKKDSKTTMIGPGGGQVTNTDGKVKVTLPADAVKTETEITVTDCDIFSAPLGAPAGYRIIYLAYLTPADIVLSVNATLTIPTPAAAAGESTVPFFRYDPATYTWVAIASGAVDAGAGTTSVSIGKFGWIAAAKYIGSEYGTVTGRVISTAGSAIAGANVWNSCSITNTDAAGNYSLKNMPSGATVIYANAAGYSSGNASVTITPGVVVTAPDIVLSSASGAYGSISGTVTQNGTLSPVSGARLTAGGKTAFSDSSGKYSITDLPSGNTTVTVYAYGYSSKSQAVNVIAGSDSALDISLDTVIVSTFSDDFETEKGWTAGSTYIYSPRPLWHRVANSISIKNTYAPAYVTLPDYSSNQGAIPLAHGGSYSVWFGEDDKGCYIGDQQTVPADPLLSGGTSNARFQGDLTSPSVDLSGYSFATLTFWTWWEIESMNSSSVDTGFDVMEVKVSVDGGSTWDTLGRLNPTADHPDKAVNIPYSSGGFNMPGAWVKMQYDLSKYAGSQIRLRFSFSTNDPKYNAFRGWFIDDLSISSSAIAPASKKK